MTKKEIIEKSCEQFKILINFFDSKKEFNADKFCNEFKKDILSDINNKQLWLNRKNKKR